MPNPDGTMTEAKSEPAHTRVMPISEMTPSALLKAVAFVQDLFPDSVPVCERPGKIDFYAALNPSHDIPLAVVDMAQGKMTVITDAENVTFTSSFPGALLLREM